MKNLGEAECAAEIRGRLKTVTATDIRRWGTLTVEEMLAHVRGAYLGTIDGPGAQPMKVPLPPRVMRFLALSVPIKWPQAVQTVPELRREAMPEPGGFSEELLLTQEAYERFAAMRENRRDHPIFGVMTPWHWMRWGYLHADHHLRQFGR